MIRKHLIVPERERRIPKQFSWVDQELVRGGHTQRVSAGALGLYLFLVAVGDLQGLSYFSDRTIGQYVLGDIGRLRAELIRADLIAYRAPLYQILSLGSTTSHRPNATGGGFKSIADVLQTIGGRRS